MRFVCFHTIVNVSYTTISYVLKLGFYNLPLCTHIEAAWPQHPPYFC